MKKLLNNRLFIIIAIIVLLLIIVGIAFHIIKKTSTEKEVIKIIDSGMSIICPNFFLFV